MFTGVCSQISFTQSGPGSVVSTQTLELTCKVTGVSLTDSSRIWAVHWLLLTAQNRLVWLGRIAHDDGKDYAPSVRGRLTLTRNINKGEVYFKLTGINLKEAGTYYAAKHTM